MRIQDIMDPALLVARDASIAEVASAMVRERSCMAVVTNRSGDAIGIITERDFLDPPASGFAREPTSQGSFQILVERAAWPAHRIMRPIPSVIRSEEPAEKAMDLMVVRGFRHLVVLAGDKPAGVVGPPSFLRLVAHAPASTPRPDGRLAQSA